MKYIPIVQCPNCHKKMKINEELAKSIILKGIRKIILIKLECVACKFVFDGDKVLSFVKDNKENEENA